MPFFIVETTFCSRYAIFCLVYKIRLFLFRHMVQTFQVNGRTASKKKPYLCTTKGVYQFQKTAHPPKKTVYLLKLRHNLDTEILPELRPRQRLNHTSLSCSGFLVHVEHWGFGSSSACSRLCIGLAFSRVCLYTD